MKKTILLIDDDLDEHEWFREALQSYDNSICCITANNCTEAIELIRDIPADVIFLDFKMCPLNGLECLKIIKQTPSMIDIPVYMYTVTKTTQEERDKALELGAVKWIAKPKKFDDYHKMFIEALITYPSSI